MTTLAAVPLAAQQAASCTGPGAAFGVTSYQCASCSIKQSQGARTQYLFLAEPIVLETSAASVLKPGDVVEAVNGEPIMTKAGGDRFTYPPAGPAIITVRRRNSRVQLPATTAGCDAKASQQERANHPLVVVDGTIVSDLVLDPATIETIEVLKGESAYSVYGSRAANGVVNIKTKRPVSTKQNTMPEKSPRNEPLIIIDGVIQKTAPETVVSDSSGGRRFGFAIGCLPSCTRTRASDGTEYYRFDGYPPIVALTPGGPAERMGIRVGDLVAQIDGKSILGEDGALRFMRGNKTETLHVTVLRDNQQVGYLLKAR